MQPPARIGPSRGVLGLLLSPAWIAVAQAQALAVWASGQAVEALLLPKRIAIMCLYVFSTGSGDLLAYLTAQPTSKMQVSGGCAFRPGPCGELRRVTRVQRAPLATERGT